MNSVLRTILILAALCTLLVVANAQSVMFKPITVVATGTNALTFQPLNGQDVYPDVNYEMTVDAWDPDDGTLTKVEISFTRQLGIGWGFESLYDLDLIVPIYVLYSTHHNLMWDEYPYHFTSTYYANHPLYDQPLDGNGVAIQPNWIGTPNSWQEGLSIGLSGITAYDGTVDWAGTSGSAAGYSDGATFFTIKTITDTANLRKFHRHDGTGKRHFWYEPRGNVDDSWPSGGPPGHWHHWAQEAPSWTWTAATTYQTTGWLVTYTYTP